MNAPATPVDLQGKKRSSQAKVVVDPVAAARAKQEHAVAAKAESILNQQLLDAFSRTNDGHSLDRVLADPELNGRFAERCRFVGLVGEPRVWNWRLLNLRKQGLLANIPTSRRTEVSWQDCDAYSYASEIALSLLLAEGYESVDEVLCDPQAAGRFDGLAASFAPGHSPFEYRWAAIKLRKDAKLARTRAALLTAGRFTRATPIAGVDWTSIPESAGIYVVGRSDESAALYVGESFNLRAIAEAIRVLATGNRVGVAPLRSARNARSPFVRRRTSVPRTARLSKPCGAAAQVETQLPRVGRGVSHRSRRCGRKPGCP